MKSRYSKVIYGLFFVICLGVFLIQAFKVSVYYMKQKTTTNLFTEQTNIRDVLSLLICCKASDCLGANNGYDHSPGFQYARGYWERQVLPIDSIKRPTHEDLVSEMSSLSIFNANEFLKIRSNFSVYHEDISYSGQLPDSSKVKHPPLVFGSLSSGLDLVCFKAVNILDAAVHMNTSYASRYFSRQKGMLIRGEVTEVAFMIKVPATTVLYITMLSGPLWYYFPKPYFSRLIRTGSTNASFTTYHRADIQRFMKLDRKSRKCIPIRSKNVKYPAGFGKYACELRCDEEVSRSIYGCSYLSIIDQNDEYPMCNKWEINNRSMEDERNHSNLWEECVRKEACNEHNYCEEWDVRLTETATLGPFTGLVNKNMSVHRFKIFIAPQLTIIEEELMISFEQWVGVVGGLMGMYVGLSFMSLSSVVIFLVDKCSKNKSVSDEVTSLKPEKDGTKG